MVQLIRLQDKDGRGPWRPGFSKLWMDEEGPDLGLPIHEDFKDFYTLTQNAHRQEKHIGTAVRENKVNLWFTGNEMKKLFSMGFKFVDCSDCEILVENDRQAIIASRLPLKFLPEKGTGNDKPR